MTGHSTRAPSATDLSLFVDDIRLHVDKSTARCKVDASVGNLTLDHAPTRRAGFAGGAVSVSPVKVLAQPPPGRSRNPVHRQDHAHNVRNKSPKIQRDGFADCFVTVTAGNSPLQESDVHTGVVDHAEFNWRFLFCWLFVVGVYLAISELVCKKFTKGDFAREISIAAFDGPSAPNSIETTVLYCEAARAHVKKLNEANEDLTGKDG